MLLPRQTLQFLFILLLYLMLPTITHQTTTLCYPPDFCSADPACVPPHVPFTHCGTCSLPGACGGGVTRTQHCGCDAACALHGDCCVDFRELCPAEHAQSERLEDRYKERNLQFECQFPHYNRDTEMDFVTTCQDDPEACAAPDTQDMVQVAPVTELSSQLHFINARCALCNGADRASLRVWDVKLKCDSTDGLNGTKHSSHLSPSLLARLKNQCYPVISAPSEVTPRTCLTGQYAPEYYTTCPDRCHNANLTRLCREQPMSLVGDLKNGNARNIYCGLCNQPEGDWSCGAKLPEQERPGFSRFSLTILMDFTFDGQSGLRVVDEGCGPGKEYVHGGCREIKCSPGEVFINNSCLRYPERNISADFHIHIELAEPRHQLDTVLAMLEDTRQYLNDQLLHTLSLIYQDSRHKTLQQFMCTIESGAVDGDSVLLNGTLSFVLKSDRLMDDQFGDLPSHNVSSVVFEIILTNLRMKNVSFQSLHVEMGSEAQYVVNADKRPSGKENCTMVLLEDDEYSLLNSSVFIYEKKQHLPFDKVTLSEGAVLVCAEDLEASGGRGPTDAQGLTTIVVMTVSLVCLLVRILLQPFLRIFWTQPMKMQFLLCVSLLLAFSLFLAAPALAPTSPACRAVAALLHWLFLSVFCWELAIAVDMFLIFRPSGNFTKVSEGEGYFWQYCVLAAVPPSLLVGACLLLDFLPAASDIHGAFVPGYGLQSCFISRGYAMILFFTIPVGIVIVLNIALFALTSRNLHAALRETRRTALQARRSSEFFIYVRLFALTGITWVFGFVAPFVPGAAGQALWYVFIVLNGLQGLYIFVSFVCTKKVWTACREEMICCGRQRRFMYSSSGSAGTNSTKSTSDSGQRHILDAASDSSNNDEGHHGAEVNEHVTQV